MNSKIVHRKLCEVWKRYEAISTEKKDCREPDSYDK
jgi:hypothetical protein